MIQSRSAPSIIVSDGLRFSYRRRRVFDGLTMVVPAGVTGVLGPNGAGKTTLFSMASTLVRPRGGTMSVLGVDVVDRSGLLGLRRRLGFLPQDFGYYPSFTVAEFVQYAAWLKKVPDGAIVAAAEAAIERVDLTDRAGEKLKSLSGGMLRRAGIAQAIVHRPALLILDEPSVGLDPEQRVSFRRMIRDLAADASVVIGTHLVEDVVATCDSVIVLHDGQALYVGSVDGFVALAPRDGPGDTVMERAYARVLESARASSSARRR